MYLRRQHFTHKEHRVKRFKNGEEIVEGIRKNADSLLYYEVVFVPSKWMKKVSIYRVFPKDYELEGYITMISLINLEVPGEITKRKGIVGDKSISFKLTSKRGERLNYNFTVYGYIKGEVETIINEGWQHETKLSCCTKMASVTQ